MIWIDYALTGLASGFLAGYLGIGGGIVLVPVLSYLFSHDPETAAVAVHMAVATSLASMLFSSLSSLLAHHRRRAIDWPLVRRLVPGLLAGALAGAVIADHLDSSTLGRVFGGFAMLIGLRLLRGTATAGDRPLPGTVPTTLVGLGIGMVSSLLGIGGGSMTVPWQLWHGLKARNAIATAAACGYPIAVAGTLGFVFLGNNSPGVPVLGYVHLQALAGVALFSVLGAPLGAAAIHRGRSLTAKRIFAVFLLVVGVKMLLFTSAA